MKKVAKILFLIYIISACFIGVSKEKPKEKMTIEKEMNVELSFFDRTITTKTLTLLLENKGKILSISFQNNLPYLDDTMEKNLSQIFSNDIKTYEELFQKQLESYGFFEESEWIHRKGVLLKKVQVQLPLSVLQKISEMSGIHMKKL